MTPFLWVVVGALVAFAVWMAAVRVATEGDGGAVVYDNELASTLLDERAREILNEDSAQYDFHDPRNPDLKDAH